MTNRYELSDQQWLKIQHLPPDKSSDPGCAALGNRNFLNGVPWILRSGARWTDLPQRCGKWKSVAQRFHPLGQVWCVGKSSRGIGQRSRQPIHHDRLLFGQIPPTGGHRKRGRLSCDADHFRAATRRRRMRTVIPSTKSRKKTKRHNPQSAPATQSGGALFQQIEAFPPNRNSV